MGELLDKRLKAVSSEAACISDAIRYRYLRSAEGSIFMTFIAPHVGRGKHFDRALDKHMQRKPSQPLPDNARATAQSVANVAVERPVMPGEDANQVELHQIRPSPQTWKPAWKDAPAWAGMLALCGNGHWYWLSHEGANHELRGQHLVVQGPHAWSVVAKVGPRGFLCTSDEAKQHWEKRT